jgi:hypothetical protein
MIKIKAIISSLCLALILSMSVVCMDENIIHDNPNNPNTNPINEKEEGQKAKYSKLEKSCVSFEFQENSGLCPWALHDEYFFKRPLFTVCSAPTFEQIKPFWLLLSQHGVSADNTLLKYCISIYVHVCTKQLYHVEIDDKDIEFVTNKFFTCCKKERLWLNMCVENILFSLNLLKDILKDHDKTTFAEWVKEFRNEIASKTSTAIPLEEIIILPTDENLKNYSINSMGYNWRPRFSPQATIQHDLSFTIPLYFSLFGNGNSYFLACLPFLDELSAKFIESGRVVKEEVKDQDNIIRKSYETRRNLLRGLSKDGRNLSQKLGARDNSLEEEINRQRESLDEAYAEIDDQLWQFFNQRYVDKEMGLIFLHASTLLHMTPLEEKDGKLSEVKPKDNKDKETAHKDAIFLKETLDNYKNSNQIDAKSRLPLMSRRPFSEMFLEISKMESLIAGASSEIEIEEPINKASLSTSSGTEEETVTNYVSTDIEEGTLTNSTISVITEETLNDDNPVTEEEEFFFSDETSDLDEVTVTSNVSYNKMEESNSADLSYEVGFENTSYTTPYTSSFLGAMGQYKNKLFSEMIKNFYKTNYGEQFLHNNAPLDLRFLLEYFNDEFKNNNKHTLKELLRNGIITTVMIRGFKKNITVEVLGNSLQSKAVCSLLNGKNEFYTKSLLSVDSPTERYVLTVDSTSKKCSVSLMPFGYDELSPPWFLNETNSMGKYKKTEMKGQDPSYGEAIIEIRGVKKVDEWFIMDEDWCSKYEDKALEPSSTFLTQPETKDTFVGQAMRLYDFLEKFDLNSPGIQGKVLTSIARGVSNANKETYSIH